MNSRFYAACAGLIARTESLDTIANNLANSNTTGFRGRHSTFSSALVSAGHANLSVLNQDANDYGSLGSTRLDNSQGVLTNTGNQLDVAIEGPGYLPVQTASGVVYTRAGNLRVSPQHQLTTAQGDPVLGDSGPITIVGTDVSISPDGTISSDGAIAGKMKVVEFGSDVDLQNKGDNYYTAPAGSAKASPTSVIHQGTLEGSNVNSVTSVVELISAQREVESMRRVLSMFNSEMDKTAAQDLPRVA